MKPIVGSIVALVTPMHPDGSVDHDALRRLVDWHIAEGTDCIGVVGTTGDPATPYRWAQALARELQNGNLITFKGEGHTAYNKGNDCVDTAVDDFFVSGTVPTTGLTCG